MDLNLKGKVAIVTGGGQGIGRAISLSMAEEGVKVIIGDIDIPAASKVVKEIQSQGGIAEAIKTDVSILEEAKHMAASVVDRYGQIDILVNNAGIWILKPFSKTSKDDWDREINIDFYGVLNCTKAVVETMKEKKNGKIINISSDAGRVGEPIQPIYSGVKGGIIAFSKALAKDVGRYRITVNTVCPSMTETENMEATVKMDDETRQRILKLYPLGRFGTPQDVANIVVFLASDRSDYITGQTISCDGGYCML